MDKSFIEEHAEEFKSEDIAQDAIKSLIKESREEGIDKVKRLFEKEYHSRNEVKKAKEALKKAEDSLTKTVEKIAKFRAGDLSVLFEDSKE